jgi:hypothetical protein
MCKLLKKAVMRLLYPDETNPTTVFLATAL